MIKSILKNILPRGLIIYLQHLRQRVDKRVASAAAYAGWASWLYYSICSRQFDREMRTVLLARRRYYQTRDGLNPQSYALRRNVHRLEKGLIMRPRRAVFGESYIVETVHYFGYCLAANRLADDEIRWAHDVLQEYFSVVASTSVIDIARRFFAETADDKSASEDNAHKPQAYASLGSVGVTFDDFSALCIRRHSVRWFEPRRVPGDLVDAALDIAVTAPSACNRQPFKFYVFDEPGRAQQIGAIPMGTGGFSHNFQCTVVVVGDLSAYPFEKDRHIIYIDSALAVMQFQLALETLGLASCSINWPDIERHEQQMARELELAPYERPVMLVAVGYPLTEALVPYSAKKSALDLVVRPK